LIGSQCWEQGILMSVNCDGEDENSKITDRFSSWTACKRASFSHNDIRSIDYSIVSVQFCVFQFNARSFVLLFCIPLTGELT